MKTPQIHPDRPRTSPLATRHPRPRQQTSTTALQQSPRMSAQRQAIRAAFGSGAATGGAAPDLSRMPSQLKSSTEALSGVDKKAEAARAGINDGIGNHSAQARQLRGLQTDGALRSPIRPRGEVIQGRFTGTLGAIMRSLGPAALGVANTYYKNLWTALDNAPVDIAVENAGGMANFDPTTNTLSLKYQILKELLDHRGGNVLDPAILADHVALITHELSHAHDSVILGRELKGEHGTANALIRISNVMMTEVQAWEREARTRQRLLPAGTNDPLWDGWFNLDPAMLVDYAALNNNRGANEVVDRYYRYLRRELVAADGDIGRVNTWFANHGAAVGAEMMRLANALIQARDTI